ncbi:Uncharacterised protein [Serratia liquefaciens]|nr:Uncharacterised protein [Serratia liquefaciens]
MSNSYFIALTLGMAAVTFLIRFSFIGLAGKIQMSERVTKNATLRAGHRSAGHHHHSDPEREFQHGVRLKKSEGDRRHHLHAPPASV